MKLAIYGYGNLGKGVELSIKQNADAELFGIFTRRDPNTIHSLTGANVYRVEDIIKFKNEIDAVIICGGSATDLPVMTKTLAADFNVVDSFDTHMDIPKHFDNVNAVAIKNNTTAVISAGWDPGMFSLNRLYASVILPHGNDYTFWGKGVSQGHSDAIRRIEGVVDARQYTVPSSAALESVRKGENPDLKTGDKHTRECYVVCADGADKKRIENEIKSMPKYFSDYNTTVHFISAEEMRKNHSEMPHGGFVIRTGKTGANLEHTQKIEYSLTLDSNPEFTGSVLVACARAVCRMNKRGIYGCKTMLDIAPSDLSEKASEELRSVLL